VGDPFFSQCANYSLTLTYPEGYQVAGTGMLLDSVLQDGFITDSYEMPAVREYAFLMRKGLHRAQRMVSGVLVESYAKTEKQARAALDASEKSLAYYFSILGETYPYPKLTIAQGALGLFGGMEYPAYTVIHESVYEKGKEQDLLRVIAHEIAHQWWYIQVGSDQIQDPWLDEGLAEYCSILALGDILGQPAMESYIAEKIEPAMRIDLPPGVVLASPIWQFASWSEYDRVIYKRSAGILHGLHLALGDEAFFASLQTLLGENRFGIADREAFACAIEDATGQNWRGYLDDYLDSRE
jgi:aminopeptidase N